MTASADKTERIGDYLPFPANYLWYGVVDILDFCGYFTDPSSAATQAIDVLSERLTRLDGMVQQLQKWVASVELRLGRAENLIRTNFLDNIRTQLEAKRF